MRIITSIALTLVCIALHAQAGVMKQDMFAGMAQTDKAVIVAIHTGTTNRTAQEKSIDRFNARMQKEFPKVDFREAWTSRTALHQQREQGRIMSSPLQLLRELKSLGYTHILIQPSYITDGVEMEHLRADVEQMKKHFKHIRLGEPLLKSERDFELAVLATAASAAKDKQGNVFVFLGDKQTTNTAFAMVDYIMRRKEMDNMYVITLKGHPDMEYLKRELKTRKEKKVNLIPCLFPQEDADMGAITVELKNTLEDAGHKVTVTNKHFGESNDVLDLFMEHARFARMNRTLSAKEQALIKE